MMSQASGRTGSRSSTDERIKAHESQLYTEVRMHASEVHSETTSFVCI